MKKIHLLYKILFLIFIVYCFIASIQIMGSGFKLFGKGFSETLIATTNNPFVGLFIGILVTSIVQSSSCSTAITVGLVAGGSITLRNSIPIIMGANIGTSVTATLVSLVYVTRKEEFRKAFAGGTVHDMYNILSVAVLLPLEVKFHFLEKASLDLTNIFIGLGGIHFMDPLKFITTPIVKLFTRIFSHQPLPITIIGLVLLFLSLYFLARLMRDLIATKAEIYLNKVIFEHPFRSFIAGLVLTGIIQSSSVTTSLIIPLIGAGIISIESFFPYMMGADIGTAFSTVLAGMATANPIALTTAFTHLLFNCIGVIIFYPLRKIPITIAKWLGRMTTRMRIIAIIYIILVFYIIPIILIWLSR